MEQCQAQEANSIGGGGGGGGGDDEDEDDSQWREL